MFDLLTRVHRHLDEHEVPHALIGAGAMAIYGYTRGTQDLDLMVADRDPRVFSRSFWGPFTPPIEVGVHGDGRFDASDPLAGVVRLEDETTYEEVDVVVMKTGWARAMLRRTDLLPFPNEVALPVVQAADLVLLKLYAAGANDHSDIRELLARVEGLADRVEERIDVLGPEEQEAWRKLRSERPR